MQMNFSARLSLNFRCGRCGLFIISDNVSAVAIVLRASASKFIRSNDAADMIGMEMRQHDHARGVERALELGEGRRIIGLTLPERLVCRLVHTGIDHDRTIRIDRLIGGARHGDGRFVAALDDEFLRTDGGRKAHRVKCCRQRTRHDIRERADGRKIGIENGLCLRWLV